MVAPPLFVCLAVWLARGIPRPQPATSIIAFAIAVPAILLPLRRFVTPFAAPDAFMIVPLQKLLDATSARFVEISWMSVTVVLVAVAVLIPRRAAVLVPVIMGIGLIGASILASTEIARLARVDNDRFFGGAERTWVNDAATGPVTYLYDGNAYWNGVWKTAFWNDRIRRVVRLDGPPVGSLPATIVAPRFDGSLTTDQGAQVGGRQIVASTAFTFFGERLAEITQTDLDQTGLRLWRTPGSPRLSTWITGLKPNGDIVQPIRIVVYACGPGRLELTLLGKQGAPVEVSANGAPAARITIVPGGVWDGSVAAPDDANGQRPCLYEIRSAGLAGSTRIEFVRAS